MYGGFVALRHLSYVDGQGQSVLGFYRAGFLLPADLSRGWVYLRTGFDAGVFMRRRSGAIFLYGFARVVRVFSSCHVGLALLFLWGHGLVRVLL